MKHTYDGSHSSIVTDPDLPVVHNAASQIGRVADAVGPGLSVHQRLDDQPLVVIRQLGARRDHAAFDHNDLVARLQIHNPLEDGIDIMRTLSVTMNRWVPCKIKHLTIPRANAATSSMMAMKSSFSMSSQYIPTWPYTDLGGGWSEASMASVSESFKDCLWMRLLHARPPGHLFQAARPPPTHTRTCVYLQCLTSCSSGETTMTGALGRNLET